MAEFDVLEIMTGFFITVPSFLSGRTEILHLREDRRLETGFLLFYATKMQATPYPLKVSSHK